MRRKAGARGHLVRGTTTLRRLIGSSVVVGPASGSRRHEGPSRMAVSRRSGQSRPPRWAARLQARVRSGSASPPPGRADEPGPAHCLFASLAWRAVCLLADAPMLPAWEASGRGHWAQLRRDPRPLLHRAGSATPKPRSGTSGRLVLVVGAWPPTGCAAPALPCQEADSRTQDCEAAHHVSWRRTP